MYEQFNQMNQIVDLINATAITLTHLVMIYNRNKIIKNEDHNNIILAKITAIMIVTVISGQIIVRAMSNFIITAIVIGITIVSIRTCNMILEEN